MQSMQKLLSRPNKKSQYSEKKTVIRCQMKLTWWIPDACFERFLRWSLNVMMSIRAIFGVRRVFFSKKSPLSKASLREKPTLVQSDKPTWKFPKLESLANN